MVRTSLPTEHPVDRQQAERLLRLHDEIDRLSAVPGPAKLALTLVASLVAAAVVLRVVGISLHSSVSAEFLVVLVISVVLMAGLGVPQILRIRALRREIEEIEATDGSHDLP